jgi:hypothetical protein
MSKILEKYSPLSPFALHERITELEKKVFKTEKKPTTLSQQLLILENLGLLNTIRKLDLSENKKVLLLSKLLNGDLSNTKKLFSNIETAKFELNYEFLIDLFNEAGLKKEADKAEKELSKFLKENQ